MKPDRRGAIRYETCSSTTVPYTVSTPYRVQYTGAATLTQISVWWFVNTTPGRTTAHTQNTGRGSVPSSRGARVPSQRCLTSHNPAYPHTPQRPPPTPFPSIPFSACTLPRPRFLRLGASTDSAHDRRASAVRQSTPRRPTKWRGCCQTSRRSR